MVLFKVYKENHAKPLPVYITGSSSIENKRDHDNVLKDLAGFL